jgi:diguanylate cyclase (GGDEF)-like protein/PAS domain S-box-containing protein
MDSRLVALLDAGCAEAAARLDAPVNVRILGRNGKLGIVASHAPDAGTGADVRAALEHAPAPLAVVDAFVTGEPSMSDRVVSSSAHVQEMIERRQISGLIVVPLIVRERTIGTMAAVRFGQATVQDIETLGAIADRLADRIDEEDLLDVIVQDQAERTLAERRQAALLRHASDVVFVLSRTGKILEVTPSVTSVLGWDRDKLVGSHVAELVDPRAIDAAVLAGPGTDGQPRTVELETRHVDGTTRWLECIGVDLLEDPAIAGYVITARDVTERHHANDLLAAENEILGQIARNEPLEPTLDAIARFVESTIDVLAPMVYTIDNDKRMHVLAAAGLPSAFVRSIDGSDLPAASRVELLSPSDGLLVSEVATDERWIAWRERANSAGVQASWSQQMRDPSGRVLGGISVFVRDTRPACPHEQHVLQLAAHLAGMAIAQDRSGRALAYAATHDPLTSLPNRAMFLDRLDKALHRSGAGESVAVVFVDLDDFKVVNDTSGHAAGDRLLREAADRLAAVVRPMDLIARLGGDEFAILCDGLDDAGASGVAARVLEVFDMPFIVDDRLFHVSASAGIAVGCSESSPDTVLRNADSAMYEAKRLGRGRHAVFTPAVREASLRRTTLASDLRHAIAAGELDVHFQPVFELTTGRIVGLEALARWSSAEHGDVPPFEFISVAESFGLIAPLGAEILRKAVEQAACWRADGLLPHDARIAVGGRRGHDGGESRRRRSGGDEGEASREARGEASRVGGERRERRPV